MSLSKLCADNIALAEAAKGLKLVPRVFLGHDLCYADHIHHAGLVNPSS
jgi:hypothetical protein